MIPSRSILELRKLHPRIYDRIIEIHIEVGGSIDPRKLTMDVMHQFIWSKTREGNLFWGDIQMERYSTFYKKYPLTLIDLLC